MHKNESDHAFFTCDGAFLIDPLPVEVMASLPDNLTEPIDAKNIYSSS